MYRTCEDFRQKIEAKYPKESRNEHSANKWLIDLRRPKDFKDSRTVYINSGSKHNPKWIAVRDSAEKKSFEYIRKPFNQTATGGGFNQTATGGGFNQTATVGGFYKTKLSSLSNNYLKEDKIGTLQVQGTNLLNEEMNQIKLLKGRKVIFTKDNEIKGELEEKNYNDKFKILSIK